MMHWRNISISIKNHLRLATQIDFILNIMGGINKKISSKKSQILWGHFHPQLGLIPSQICGRVIPSLMKSGTYSIISIVPLSTFNFGTYSTEKYLDWDYPFLILPCVKHLMFLKAILGEIDLSHLDHANSFSSVWIPSCVFKTPFCVNDIPHLVHVNGSFTSSIPC